MKKILSILLFSFCLLAITASTSFAQMTQTGTSGASKTTHTNADTSFHKVDLRGEVSNFKTITITCAGTKVSGTVGGTVVPFGSIDGSRWFQLYDKDSVSSQSLTNGDNDLKWQFNDTRWNYMRMRIYTTGTQVSRYTCYFLGRKTPGYSK